MMQTMSQPWRRALPAAILLAALGVGVAHGDTPPAGGGSKPDTKKEEKPAAANPPETRTEPLQLKIFRLQHRDPQALLQVAERLIVPVMPPPPAGPKMQGGFGGFGFMGGNFMGAGFMGAGFMGAGFMGQGPPIPVEQGNGDLAFGFTGAVSPRLVADSRARTLIIRGSKDNLQVVRDLVTLLDLPKGKAPPKVKGLRAFELRFADPGTVISAVEQLGIPARIGGMMDSKTLIARGTEAELQEVSQVIEALDVKGERPPAPPGAGAD
jgi:hypothetical protein